MKKTLFFVLPYLLCFLLSEGALRAVYYQRFGEYPLAWMQLLQHVPFLGLKRRRLLHLPASVLAEFSSLKAPIDNAGNPTGVSRHDTLLVVPDADLGYRLRPNVALDVYLLHTSTRYNWDPPVLHLPHGVDLSATAQGYLKTYGRLHYAYSTNAEGMRTTLPVVVAAEKILVVGDSVGFGVGVNDADTFASRLQRRLGASLQVANASVGGYTGRQAVKMARLRSARETFAGVIYLACQNDFAGHGARFSSLEAAEVLQELAALKARFSGRVLVILQTYMEYNLRDMLQGEWSRKRIRETDDLRRNMRRVSAELGFAYLDWSDLVQREAEERGSIFSRFALYADHVHLSPYGNERLAQAVLETWELP